MKFLIGKGVLNWNRGERVSDRYGAIYLGKDVHSDEYNKLEIPEGKKGTVVAVILKNRESTHIGDMFRGLGPSKPDVGERVVLGTGVPHIENNPHVSNCQMLVLPQERESDWYDPKALYRCHEQTVELYLEVGL